MIFSWLGIKIPPHIGIKDQGLLLSRLKVKWKPPKEGWHKLNFDGASRGNIGPSGVCYIIRDSNGETIGWLSNTLKENTNNIEKFETLKLFGFLCREMDNKKLEIEGVSSLVVNVVR